MQFRKLFRESGRPRSGGWEQGGEPSSSNKDWAALLPLSSSEHVEPSKRRGDFQYHPHDLRVPFQSIHHTFYQPSHHNNDSLIQASEKQLYPGFDQRPLYQHHCEPPLQNPERLPSTMYESFNPVQFQSSFANEAKDQRPGWKSKLLNRMGDIQGTNRAKGDTIKDTPTDVDNKNVLWRVVDALKRKRIMGRRSTSIDVDLAPFSRLSYLPDQDSLQHRAKMNRRSLDGHFDSIQPQNEIQRSKYIDDSVVEAPYAGFLKSIEHGMPSTTGFQNNHSLNDVEVVQTQTDREQRVQPVSGPQNTSTLDSRLGAPLLPLKLNPPPACSGNHQVYSQKKHHAILPPPLPVPKKPQPHHRSPAGKTLSTAGQDEWQQIRGRAVRKFEDWVGRSSQDLSLQCIENVDQKKVVKVGDRQSRTASSTIDSEALQETLGGLLKKSDMQIATQETRHPVSSQQRQAVIKAKAETRRGNGLEKMFAVHAHDNKTSDIRESIEMQAKTENHPESSTHRRGFAEKMLPRSTTIQPDASFLPDRTNKGDVTFEGPSTDLFMATPLSQRQRNLSKPLPGPPEELFPNEKASNAVTNREKALVLGNSLPVSCHRGSFASPNTNLAPNDRDGRAKEELEAWKSVKVVPQLGRLTDLDPSIQRFVDSNAQLQMQENAERKRFSITESEIEIINRIEDWRMLIVSTPIKVLYAASASATEPSDCYHRANDDQSSSRLTSVSKGVGMGRVVEKEPAEESRMEEEGQASHSTVVHLPSKNGQEYLPVESTGLSIDKQQSNRKIETPILDNNILGTKHIRQLSQIESRKLFALQDLNISDGFQAFTPPISVPLEAEQRGGSTASKEKQIPDKEGETKPSNHKEPQWQELLRNLANDLDDDVDAVVETLLNRYSGEMKQFYKGNPEMLLLVSLRARLIRAVEQEGGVKRGSERGGSNLNQTTTPQKNSTKTSSIHANCSFDPDAISSWLGDERQVEKALQKIIDYVENAGEISQLQKSLLGLHQNLLDRTIDTSTIDRRLSLLEQAVYTQR